ncbi:MAG TPA: LPS export ABC transporter periplasmic protein LptC [Azoarcus sp.]|nr:LPS export ABC transporter periplasmic protein LptC [Azoarcus sp.]
MRAFLRRRPERILPILALALLASLTIWLERITRPDEAPEVVQRTDPDFIGYDIRLVSFDEQGLPRYELLAERVTHYPASDLSDYVEPRLHYALEGGGELNIRSKQGEAYDGGERILLSGDVVVHRSPTETEAEVQVDAETLMYWPDTQQAASDDPVRIRRNNSIAHGDGLRADNIMGTLELRGNTSVEMPRGPRNSS